jgi:hypothetical protein
MSGWPQAARPSSSKRSVISTRPGATSTAARTAGQPGKLGRHDGFRIVGPQAGRVRKLNRKWAAALVPKVGWIRFRLSRAVPGPSPTG